MPKKKGMPLKEVVGGILVISAIIIFYSFASSTPTVRLSCEDGTFIGFGHTSMPQMCAACIPQCEGRVEVKTESGDLVCSNLYREDRLVGVPCPDLKKYKGQNLVIKYWINSTNGNYSGEIKSQYER